ncbi:DUF3050 domain-containing protein [Flavobacterium agricola]|uniref:DUF3050 domain-containing protein n=1 Tax=Flavobacterium agricola TaxID=2870839 RepID=A0ABY6M0F4_9FLAO|nr:DUF3050 domain-containing protein [Flavobacterium agricola]UYW01302.1 DUF3050 domain-containing protein [Flavobacterium agricola]
MSSIQAVNQAISGYKSALLKHPLYNEITNIQDLHAFTEGHVYAVWDFMSLLKALQIKLTCVQTPWFASEHTELRYLINAIVLGEESDETLSGSHQSHFEMYLDAMQACGASTQKITAFLQEVVQTQNIFVAIKTANLHPNIKRFLDFTFNVIEHGKTHEIAAAFTFGREDLIPKMFTEILKEFKVNFPNHDLSKLIYYFERHIELDADEHGPMAFKMLEVLCGTDNQKWKEVEAVAIEALECRMELWDAILENITAETMA